MSGLFTVDRGDGTPLIVLHGLTIDHRMMLPLDPVIEAAGSWRRHYVDLPGHGRSTRVEPMTTDTTVSVVADYVTDVVGERRFALLAASFGGAVALELTDRFQDQLLGCALLAPAVLPRRLRTLPPPAATGLNEAFLQTLPCEDRAAFTAVTAQQDPQRWTLFKRYIQPGLLAHDRGAVAELAAWQATARAREPQRHLGRHLIVTGRQDTVVGWRDQVALLDVFPHATYTALDDCGHNVHLEHSDVVAGLLTAWLHALRD
ncbi:alpha/beta fold hydrolase [Tsukamurella tyrosinosolvens]|uniref:alpha/beta fold hydrolase n=1 Tax=Tsukamurella tyrosinosolvens TaxID=57704 RepID=UPI001AF64C16|nr:alpha/beta fold hydrolase [Tsukamurella tyrosinosolvens]QRY82603.1 alpha/beta fold hydrolase [Tsukamurella tyrosinosolvens]